MRLRAVIILFSLIIFIGFLAYQIDISFPGTPSVNKTFTLLTQPTQQEIGSYDLLGKTISKDIAASLLQTVEGRAQLSPENGAVAVNDNLVNLGRKTFYNETLAMKFSLLR